MCTSTTCIAPQSISTTNVPDGRAVVGDDDKLGLARAQCLEAGLVAQRVLARLHDQRQTAVDALLALLALFGSCGCHDV